MLFFFVIVLPENKKWECTAAGLELLSMTLPRLCCTTPKGCDRESHHVAWYATPDSVRNQIE